MTADSPTQSGVQSETDLGKIGVLRNLVMLEEAHLPLRWRGSDGGGHALSKYHGV